MPLGLPDALFAQALVDGVQEIKDDRIAVLYLGNPSVLAAYRAILERVFVLRCADGSACEQEVRAI